MTKNYYISGDHNVTCDVCSKKIKMSEAKLRWDGFLVCKDDYEMRHPQDFVRARQDKISVDNTRPIPPNTFILLNPIFESFTVSDNIITATDYVRPFSDVVATSENMTFSAIKNINETVTINENISLPGSGKLQLSDSVIIGSFGYTFQNDYIDITYFESDYVGITQFFE